MTTTVAKRNDGNSYAGFGNAFDNIFQNSLRRFFGGNFWDGENDLTMGSVPVNIRETEQQYELDVIAPGCRKEDFKISIDNNMLTVSMQKKEENNSGEKAGWVRNEFVPRPFTRTFNLDETVDVSKITATYADGILLVGLGKNEKAKMASRQIEVK